MKKTKLILGNITFEGNTAIIHEIHAIINCKNEKIAEELGEDLCNIFLAYVIPSMYNGKIVFECDTTLNAMNDIKDFSGN